MSENFILTATTSEGTIYKFLVERRGIDIRIGNAPSLTECILIVCHPGETEIVLEGISYDSECSYDKPMPSGEGTRTMLKAALLLMAKWYPDRSNVVLDDNSKFKCKNNNIDINLRTFSILLHGKTWYERHFGARLPVKENRDSARNNRIILSEPIPKNFQEITQIDKQVFDKCIGKNAPKVADLMHSFRIINNNIGCGWFTEERVARVFDALKLVPFRTAYWVIPMDKVRAYGVQISIAKTHKHFRKHMTKTGGGTRPAMMLSEGDV
jgi:hypothetical protein